MTHAGASKVPSGGNGLVAAILAGGSGTRFWPLSTEERPKQFLRLIGERTMLQHTFDRLRGLVPPERVLVVTSARFSERVRSELPEIPKENVIGEPLPRDTAAAVVLAAVAAKARFGERHPMIVLPADHMIRPIDRFQQAVRSAVQGALESGSLYTFGITPAYPATGYGYLECGDPLGSIDGVEHFRLLRFKEKPDQETAEEYLRRGGFFWNSGMFAWGIAPFLEAIARHLPEHARALFPLEECDASPAWERRLKEAFIALPKVSIDYGLMEKAEDVRMVKASFEWSDVGGWVALGAFLPTDPYGNAVQGEFHAIDAQNNLVYCDTKEETVALIGVRDLVVVRAGMRTLIVHRDRVEEVKRLVEQMRSGKAQGL